MDLETLANANGIQREIQKTESVIESIKDLYETKASALPVIKFQIQGTTLSMSCDSDELNSFFFDTLKILEKIQNEKIKELQKKFEKL